MVDGEENVAKVKNWREATTKEARRERAGDGDGDSTIGQSMGLADPLQYLRIATFSYDLYTTHNIQTFPVDEEISRLGIDFGIVILRIKSNWGREEYTCLYRFRVHGQTRDGVAVDQSGKE